MTTNEIMRVVRIFHSLDDSYVEEEKIVDGVSWLKLKILPYSTEDDINKAISFVNGFARRIELKEYFYTNEELAKREKDNKFNKYFVYQELVVYKIIYKNNIIYLKEKERSRMND